MRRDWPSNSAVLLKLGEGEKMANYWSVNDAFQGTQIFGATGSGKSSGSGQAIAHALLKSNFGGLVLTAKTDERAAWEEYDRAAERSPDLLIFSPKEKHRFNFLRYEHERHGDAGNVESLVNLFWSVMEVADRKSSGGGGEAYWGRAMKQLLRNAIDLMVMATGDLDLAGLYRIITSAPTTAAQAESEEWRTKSDFYLLILEAEAKTKGTAKWEDCRITRDFWLQEYAQLANETRSGIVSMFTSMADCFLRGMMREMFCTGLNFRPEDCFKGKIIILDLPVKEFHELGIFSQVLFKFIWQRAVERRIPAGISSQEAQEEIRPVFLWADESQFFVNGYDALFQSTARSSRACTVFLTQNLPGYQSAFQSAGGGPAAEAFLGNLQTKIFHANGDPRTNEWAASSIGRIRQLQFQGGLSQGEQNRGSSQNAGASTVFEYVVQPQEFTELRTGGIENRGIVDSVIFQGGRRWMAEEGKKEIPRNFLRHSFAQKQR